MRVLELCGTPFQIGEQHGCTLRKEIGELVVLWKTQLQKQFEQDPGHLIKRFLNETDFVSAIERHTPNLLDEVHGIAHGSNQSFETMLAFQFMDEIWLHGGDAGASFPSLLSEKCTCVGSSHSRGTVIAQNMDLEAFRDGYQIVLRLKLLLSNESWTEQLVLSQPGFIGLTGLNDYGVALVVNALPQLQYDKKGLPVAFVVRGILQQQSVTRASAFIREVPHASGQNYILGSSDSELVQLEACSTVVVSVPFEGCSLVHTNHPLTPEPQFNAAYMLDNTEATHEVGLEVNSRARLEASTAFLAEATKIESSWGGMMPSVMRNSEELTTMSKFQRVLRLQEPSDHPVSRQKAKGGDGMFTFASIVMMVGQDEGGDLRMLTTAGPPHLHKYGVVRMPKRKAEKLSISRGKRLVANLIAELGSQKSKAVWLSQRAAGGRQ
jgi:predicted choloylglycine hydrolase